MTNLIKIAGVWLTLVGHILFGVWLKKKMDGAADAHALRAGAKAERKAPNNRDELISDLEAGKE